MHTFPTEGTKLEIRLRLHLSCYCLAISITGNAPDFSICAELYTKGGTLPFSGIVKDHSVYFIFLLLLNNSNRRESTLLSWTPFYQIGTAKVPGETAYKCSLQTKGDMEGENLRIKKKLQLFISAPILAASLTIYSLVPRSHSSDCWLLSWSLSLQGCFFFFLSI